MGEAREAFSDGASKCGHCGGELHQKDNPRYPRYQKKYCSDDCKKSSSHLRRYWHRKQHDATRHIEESERRRRTAAAWREKARKEGRCVRCGRDNDRTMLGMATCTNCIIDLKR